MAAKLVLGIDVESTRAVLTQDGVVVSHHSLPWTNLLLDPTAIDRLVGLITETNAELVGVGMPGLRNALQLLRMTNEVRDKTGATFTAADDATIALLGAFAGGPGIVVFGGMGSSAVGWSGKGRVSRVGGHGFLLGDHGSLYSIGREAVSSALESRDGTGPTNTLPQIIESALGMRLDDLVLKAHSELGDRRLLGKVPSALARSDDPVARAILEAAADRLIALATALRTKMGQLPVALVGGVSQFRVVADRFNEATGGTSPLEAPQFGAVRLATGDRNARDTAFVM